MRLSLARWAFNALYPISKKFKKRILVAAAVGLMSLPLTASAQFSAPGVGGFGPIADGGPANGTPGASTISTATIVGSAPVQTVSIDFGVGGIDHTWAGDLTIRLTAPDGTTTADVISRPGLASTSSFGFNTDFSASNSYSFSDAGAATFAVLPGAVVPSGDIQPSSNPNPPNVIPAAGPYVYTPVSFGSTFGGLNSAGVWTLTINDWAAGDTGNLNGWTLNVTPVPEPVTMSLVGLAGLGLLALRRKL